MGKSVRAKVKKRLRSSKRRYLEEVQLNEDMKKLSDKQKAIIHNLEYREPEKKNAFLHPDDPTAVFHQYKPQTHIDFRSSNIPFAGYEFAGAKRKKNKPGAVKTYDEDAEEDRKNNEIDVEEEEAYGEEPDNEGEEEEVGHEDDLISDFGKMKLPESKRKQRRNKMNEETEFVVQKNSKKIKKNGKVACKKSKKILKF